MQNEKELIRLRRFMPAARITRARQGRAISPAAISAARTTLHQGGSNFACDANYPHQALKTKGGLFCICLESRNLT